VSAACQIPIVTPAMEFPHEVLVATVQGAAELCWANNTLLHILGHDAEGRTILCDDDCGTGIDGAVTVCAEVEAVSRYGSLPPEGTVLPLSKDGRTAYAWPAK
jgi:hypothetical protein